MITKSYEFDRKFHQDIKKIQLTRKPFRIKGSYSVKEYGEFITDIDIEAFVHYDSKLLKLIYSMLERLKYNRDFTFLHASSGIKKDFQLPWSIDNNGGCYFNLDNARKWFAQFSVKKLIPQTDLIVIKNLLFKDTISMHDLCRIEKIIEPYSEIKWNKYDIKNGYKIVDRVKYDLLTIMMKEGFVLEFIYHYKDTICAVDMGLLDFKYRTKANHMISYYMKDWYKVMKTYRWKLREEYKSEYLSIMKQVGKAISIKYQIELLHRIKNTSIPLYTINLFENSIISRLTRMKMKLTSTTTKEIYYKVNEYLKKYVKYFSNHLEPKYIKTYIIYMFRGKEGQIQVPIETLKAREKAGINCPFFRVDIEDFSQMIDLSIKMLLDPQKIFDCFTEISNQANIPLKKLIHSYGINSLSLSQRDNSIVLKDSGKDINIYPLSKKKELQIRVLLEKN